MKLTLNIDLGNAAFKYETGELDHGQVADTVRGIQFKIARGDTEGTVQDKNGNEVGSWAITGE